jgi:hypothetical protein
MAPGNKSDHIEDPQIRRFLLGLLPEHETERLEEASIADDDFAARLRTTEGDLVDSYARGTLDEETRQRFQSWYLSTDRRRRNVQFASSFVHAVDRVAAPPAGADERASGAVRDEATVLQSTAVAVGRKGLRFRLTSRLMLAAALLVVTCGVLLVQVVRLRVGLTSTDSTAVASDALPDTTSETAPQPLGTPSGGVASAAPNQTQRGQRAAPEPLGTPSGPIALLLLPQTRAAGPIATLDIPAGVPAVTIELRLESNDSPGYVVGLQDPASNRILWRSVPIAPRLREGVASVAAALPTRLLKPQHYSLTVSGTTAGNTHIVGTYTFEVTRR